MSESMIDVQHLSSGYNGRIVLRDVSLKVQSGQSLLLMGPNGAGKSTLLKTLCGLLRASSGAIVLNGQTVGANSAVSRFRSALTYLSQGGPVFGNLTVEENVQLAAAYPSCAPIKLELLPLLFQEFPFLKQRSNLRAGLLSGGQRRCLALTMAVARRSPVMLLDEPTAGMAPNLAAKVVQVIQSLATLGGAAIILTEHRIREALRVVDRALLLRNGESLIETGSPLEWLDGSAWGWAFGGRAQVKTEE